MGYKILQEALNTSRIRNFYHVDCTKKMYKILMSLYISQISKTKILDKKLVSVYLCICKLEIQM